MTIWVDAQLSPAIAIWIASNFSVSALALRELGLRDADDETIFQAAKQANAVVMTKDQDFVLLQERFGVPPQIIWLTCGNTSNAHLKRVLQSALPQAFQLLDAGEPLVEISDIW